MPNDIIVTAPLPPFLYGPLKADYRCHDYVEAADKPAFLAGVGGTVRGLVQGGGTVTPTTLLDALPKLEIISVFGVGYDGVPVDYCRARGLKVTNTPDVLTDDVADVALALIMMTGRGFVRLNRFVQAGGWLKQGPELTTKLGGRTVGILGLGPHRQGDRRARLGAGDAGRLHRPQAAGRSLPLHPGPEGARRGGGFPGGGLPRRRGDAQHRRCARCSRRSARRARSSTSRAARSSTSPRWSRRSPTARSRRRASTCSPTSRRSRRRCSRWTTWCCCRTSAAPPTRRARRWATCARPTSTRGSRGSRCRR